MSLSYGRLTECLSSSIVLPAVDRGVNDGFKFNRETEFVPIAGLVETELNADKDKSAEKKSTTATSIQDNHHPAILAVLAEELSVSAEEIHDFELYVKSDNVLVLIAELDVGIYTMCSRLPSPGSRTSLYSVHA